MLIVTAASAMTNRRRKGLVSARSGDLLTGKNTDRPRRRTGRRTDRRLPARRVTQRRPRRPHRRLSRLRVRDASVREEQPGHRHVQHRLRGPARRKGRSVVAGVRKPTASSRSRNTDLLPGEDRLFELVDPIVPALEAQPPHLQQHRAGRGVNQVVAQRDLHDRTRAFAVAQHDSHSGGGMSDRKRA
jgi:hypothetical protein